MDVHMTMLPERCTEKVNVYHVSLQNFKERSRIYGILSKPKKEGSYPAVLAVPGAGIRPYNGNIDLAEAGLDKRVKYLAAMTPALSNMSGYLNGRAGGWPHMFHPGNASNITDDKIETALYFDVANFARQVTQEGWYSWGFNDVTCPPTSMYSAYNVINASKELHLFQDSGHWSYPEQLELINQ